MSGVHDQDVHLVLVLAQNTEVGTDAWGCRVLLLVPSTKVGVDGRGVWQQCVTGLGVGQSLLKGAWQDLEPGVVKVCD